MKIIAHKVGNKVLGETLQLYPELVLDENTIELLQNYFLGSFKTEETFQFYSDSYLSNNPIFNASEGIFNDQSIFDEWSKDIAKHLFEAAENPRVQGGELFVVFFPKLDETDFDKVGIFKTEKRESFLKIHPNSEYRSLDLEQDKGISLAKIDKAALIYNNDKENGYILSVVDNNKNGDMYYWFEDFLKVKQRQDDYFHTQETLSVFKTYIKDQLPTEFEVSTVDQADFMNKSLTFFKEKEEFKFEEFTAEVLEDKAVIESFEIFKSCYEQDMQISISEDFPISAAAVKKQQSKFKSIIKLDTNFHIYIHGDRNKIEDGQDEKGKFYKLYFEEQK